MSLTNLINDLQISSNLNYAHSFETLQPGDTIPENYLTNKLFFHAADNFINQADERGSYRSRRSIKKRSEKLVNLQKQNLVSGSNYNYRRRMKSIKSPSQRGSHSHQAFLESKYGERLEINRNSHIYPKSLYQALQTNNLREKTKFKSILTFITISLNLDFLVIKSNFNNEFICMKKNSRIVKTQKFLTDDCLFQKKFEKNHFMTFKSVKYSSSMNKNNKKSSGTSGSRSRSRSRKNPKDCYLAIVKTKKSSRSIQYGSIKKVCRKRGILENNFYLWPSGIESL